MKNGEAGFLGFAREILKSTGKSPARHHQLLISHLQDIADGRSDRLMVQMPPGSAKSTYGSVLFPAYFLAQQPNNQVIATAHTASLADYFGRHSRDVIAEHGKAFGLSLRRNSRAAGEFSLENGGEYFAAGVRGPITGRRADLIIVDDPVKSWAEAESPALRDALYEWYQAELTARMKPGGRIVLIMTRWHEDDLAGRLLQTDDGGWVQLKLPALAEADDPLGREPGAALWPEWQDEAAIKRRRHEVGEQAFSALYQQNPLPPGATMFDVKAIPILAEAPPVQQTIRAWDLAASQAAPGRDPDYTVGLKLGVIAEQDFVVLDIVRLRGTPMEVEARIQATAEKDGKRVIISLPQDPGQAGVAQVAMYRKMLAGFELDANVETGSKANRATAASTLVARGNLKLIAAPWNDVFLSEISAFPNSRKDDQVDALSRAVNKFLIQPREQARRLNLPLLQR